MVKITNLIVLVNMLDTYPKVLHIEAYSNSAEAEIRYQELRNTYSGMKGVVVLKKITDLDRNKP